MSFALCGIFDPLQDQREERVRDVGNGDQELARPEGPQVLGRGVRRVRHDFDRVQHAAACFRRDHLRTAQYTRHRRRGYPRPFRNLVDVRHRRLRRRTSYPSRSRLTISGGTEVTEEAESLTTELTEEAETKHVGLC